MWPENYSVNSAQKVWAASFAAHHPNVVVLDLSSLQVRPRRADLRPHRLHHRPRARRPYAALHDIDANKPSGSIKIRVKTYAHALKLHEERLQDARKRKGELLHALDEKRLELLELRASQLAARRQQDPAIEAQLEELRVKVAAYEAPMSRAEVVVAQGVIQLGKKTADGVASRAVERSRTAGNRQ